MIPGIIINLVQRIIIVSQRIIDTQEFLFTHRFGDAIVFRQEITAHIRVRITNALVIIVPRDRADSVEQTFAAHLTGRHFLQVVCCCQIVCHQLFRLQATSIAIHFHLVNIGESRFPDQLTRQLIDTRRRHTDFCPASRSQYGMGGIVTFCSIRCTT